MPYSSDVGPDGLKWHSAISGSFDNSTEWYLRRDGAYFKIKLLERDGKWHETGFNRDDASRILVWLSEELLNAKEVAGHKQ